MVLQAFKDIWQPRGVRDIEEAVHGGSPAPDGGVPPHWHEEWQLCCVVRGDGWVRVHGAQHRTAAGSLFAIPPGEVHSNDMYEQGCDYRSMLVRADTIERACGDAHLRHDPAAIVRFPLIPSPRTVRHFVHFHQLLDGDRRAMEVECRFADLVGELISHLSHQVAELPRREPHPAARRARELLRDQADQQISLASLAEQCGLSLYELVRQFKASYGLPPHAWQLQARIVKGKAMLRRGEAVSHVALATGFCDQAHFTRMFRRLVGATPARYAQRFRKIVQDSTSSSR